jgi:exosortase/archaeosortase family protein
MPHRQQNPAGVSAGGMQGMGVTSFDASRNGTGAASGTAVPASLLFLGVAVTGFINGISEKVAAAIERDGFMAALSNTFDVSIVIWAAIGVAAFLLWGAERRPARRVDFGVAALASATFLFPAPFASWLGISLAGAYLWLARAAMPDPRHDPLRRAGAVLLALTVPMLWARMLFAAASTRILEIDARLVGWIVGTGASGNTIPLADGSGVIFLEPACSSLTNVSLAMLCGVLFVSAQGLKWSKRAIAATLLACAATVFINVLRIALIGVMPQYYSTIHGPTGATIAAWVTVLAILAIFTKGIRSDAAAA